MSCAPFSVLGFIDTNPIVTVEAPVAISALMARLIKAVSLAHVVLAKLWAECAGSIVVIHVRAEIARP